MIKYDLNQRDPGRYNEILIFYEERSNMSLNKKILHSRKTVRYTYGWLLYFLFVIIINRTDLCRCVNIQKIFKIYLNARKTSGWLINFELLVDSINVISFYVVLKRVLLYICQILFSIFYLLHYLIMT